MIWHLEPIHEAPSRTLDAWMVVAVPLDGADRPWTAHLVGWSVETTKGRVSSAVEMLDPQRRLARTRSGRVYELRHGPGLNGDAFSTWCQWKADHGVEVDRDISDEVNALLSRA